MVKKDFFFRKMFIVIDLVSLRSHLKTMANRRTGGGGRATISSKHLLFNMFYVTARKKCICILVSYMLTYGSCKLTYGSFELKQQISTNTYKYDD